MCIRDRLMPVAAELGLEAPLGCGACWASLATSKYFPDLNFLKTAFSCEEFIDLTRLSKTW